MHTGQLLGSGRTADVYELDGSWVLRRYRDRSDTTEELAVMSYVRAFGYPVPRIGPPAGGARPTDLVLQRLTGPTMAEALRAGALGAAEGGVLLARLLRELHAIPPRVSADPQDCILHLDLHPENVMLTDRGPVVIDWSTATEGPPGLDRAMSALTLARVALDPEFPAPEAEARTLLTSLLTSVLTSLLAELADDGGTDADDLARARDRQRESPFLTAPERGCLDAAVEMVLDCAPSP
ncbi:phosphotransferase [Streptomyces cyaneofuscatus]|uniref:phosphotransferase n=1 Tax=Streptomyces cyaneofuscatus TaxID=66883 RepID=UPI00364EAFDA